LSRSKRGRHRRGDNGRKYGKDPSQAKNEIRGGGNNGHGSGAAGRTGLSRVARAWRLLRTDSGFRVIGSPPSEEELERALRAAGAKDGATVEIGEEEFELA